MSEKSITSTNDITEAYKKNIGFYIPGYGHVTNFKNFYDNELQGKMSLADLSEGVRTDPKFIDQLDAVLNSGIKQYDKGGTSEPELIRTDSLSKDQTKSDDYKVQYDYIPQNRSTFAEKFKDYKNSKEMEALFVLNEYEKLDDKIKKDKPNNYSTFKEAFAAERRKAIKDNTLDTHTFEYTNTKTGETRLYHARTVNEQAKWLKRRREEEDA